ncbi:hypothetical protein [uncultured Pseudoalteromonas sp.]|nr:hypothetical protein [uncultured Pseudoalteromonas sp.]
MARPRHPTKMMNSLETTRITALKHEEIQELAMSKADKSKEPRFEEQ